MRGNSVPANVWRGRLTPRDVGKRSVLRTALRQYHVSRRRLTPRDKRILAMLLFDVHEPANFVEIRRRRIRNS